MRISLPSGTTAEVARPSGPPAMGLVVIPDILGLRPLFDDHCARLAHDNGWSVCAFELYPGRASLDADQRMAAAKDNDDARILGDAVAAAKVTGCERVGVIGFCMGGMYALKSVATGRFARVVAFYGMIRVPAPWQGRNQREPLDALAGGDPSTVLAIIGTDDGFTPPDDVDALEATGATVVRYRGAGHGFVHDPSRPLHRPDDAADAWARARAWLVQ